MLGAVGRCCTGALQALKPGVQPLKALVGSPSVLGRRDYSAQMAKDLA
uniref:ATP synthase subunit beta, mitochondrial n=1 Tax=Salmo salar TaxID=8030 RepID=B5XDM2_SALSA|nr:ATP synthase subunit beta, mitochondrial precursor [Salmo salar]ACI70204.1 ATP synthase subunit beta, mitochondrial precursor [Salmo salar]